MAKPDASTATSYSTTDNPYVYVSVPISYLTAGYSYVNVSVYHNLPGGGTELVYNSNGFTLADHPPGAPFLYKVPYSFKTMPLGSTDDKTGTYYAKLTADVAVTPLTTATVSVSNNIFDPTNWGNWLGGWFGIATAFGMIIIGVIIVLIFAFLPMVLFRRWNLPGSVPIFSGALGVIIVYALGLFNIYVILLIAIIAAAVIAINSKNIFGGGGEASPTESGMGR